MISVLLVSYNVRDDLARCIASIGAAAEIIVADNASPDGSAAYVRGHYPSVRLLELGRNRGFGAAVNAAARVATGELFLVLNPDTTLSPALLAGMAAALERRPRAWAMGFRQVDGDGQFQLSLGPPPSLLLELGRRFVQRRLDAGDRRLGELLGLLLSRPMPVPWVSGAAMLVRRAAFERVGGFDTRFFLYFEDIDFCLRLRQAGGAVYYDPTVVITHLRGASARTASALAARAYRESQLYFWEKHRGPWVRRLVHWYLQARELSPEHFG